MTVHRPFSAEDATLGDGLSMLVVERPTKKAFSIVEIKTSDEVQEELVQAWEATLEKIADDEALVEYSQDLVLHSSDTRIPVVATNIGNENEIVGALLADADRAQDAPQDINADDLYLYGLISDTDGAGRVAMIKKRTPAKRATKGKWWAFPGDELTRIEHDPWQIYPHFDLVISEQGAYVLNLRALDQLLADSEILIENVDDWVGAIAAALPIAEDQADILSERCKESSRLRQRLRAINDRKHLQRVTIEGVEAHARRMHLEPADFIEDDQLVVNEANADQLLKLLNEDLFTGGLTGDPFLSGGKEPFSTP